MQKLSLDHFHLPAERKYHIYRIHGSEVSQQPHTHSYYQICYVAYGRVEHQQDHSTVPLTAGDAFIVPPGFVHQILFPDPEVCLYSLSFQEDLFHSGFSQSNVYHFMTALKLETMETERIPIRMKVTADRARQQTLQALLDALIREQDSTSAQELTAAGSLIAATMCILSQCYFADDTAHLQQMAAYSEAMTQCLRYIDMHFTEDLTLEETARKFGLSRSGFGVLFPQHTGTTFKRYLAKRRIEYAITLLRSTQLTVQQIAGMCGYKDLSTFHRNFTKVTGVSPTTFRTTKDLETHLYMSMGWLW